MSTRIPQVGLTLLRVTVGIVFLAHGAQKLFSFGLDGVTASFEGMGVPLPALAAAFAMGVEFLGGLALILGLFTRVAAPLLAIDMLGALLFVHLGAGFFLPEGYEFVLTLLAASVALTLAGPGALALDNVLGTRMGPGITGTAEPDETRAAA